MRIAFLGTPEFTLPLLEACAAAGELSLVVAQPDKPVGRHREMHTPPSAQWARARGIRLEQPEKIKQGRLAAILQSARPDVAVVAAYGRILPADVLGVPSLGCLNVHASLLPELRGAAPAQWAIARGYRETGVTIMQVDEGLDTGDIRLQRSLAVHPRETGETLLARLADLGAKALSEALRLLARGELPRTPQDTTRATYAPLLKREDGRVDFNRTAQECDQRMRGFTPWPGAWTTLRGHVLKILAAEPDPRPADRPPGHVLDASPEGILVACASSAWRLQELQLEGKKRLSAEAFLAGARLRPGELLGT